jgi:5'-nucleotidase
MKKIRCLCILMFLIAIASPAAGADKRITIVHTNDLHSHFLGFSPNIDYSPLQAHNDDTVGGWARIATAIKQVKQARSNPVLVLDAGDFLMGSLFHMLSRENAFELQLMKTMGYDVITLGNHEFDLKPAGLARILSTAHGQGQLPPIVLSNAIFSKDSPDDDALEKIFDSGIVKPYRIMEKNGVRIGFFGLMGKDAAEVAPFSAPVTFDDPIASAQKMVKVLREKEKVDMVVCLSHSGLADDPKRSEDEILARQVPGIDVIISGHTHTKTDVRRVDDTLIVQTGSYGRQLGVLDINWSGGKASVQAYRLIKIDDAITGDGQITAMINGFEDRINRKLLADKGLEFRKRIAHTAFNLEIKENECNLGNLIADSIRWTINQAASGTNSTEAPVAVGVISNGVIRDNILIGQTGDIAVCDAFRAIPLGIGFDETASMGYPLISFYIYPGELKKALEILTSIYPMKGDDYYLQLSGVKFSYNPNRMLFDRVTQIWLGDKETGYTLLDYSASNKRLIRVAADIYNATFLKVVGNFTWHVLDIIPKDADGRPVPDLKSARVDADPNTPGIQELKEYMGVLSYIQSFPDSTGNGMPDVPEKYRGPLGRQLVEASWNPYKLLKRGTYVTWIAVGVLLFALLIIILLIGLARRIIKKL